MDSVIDSHPDGPFDESCRQGIDRALDADDVDAAVVGLAGRRHGQGEHEKEGERDEAPKHPVRIGTQREFPPVGGTGRMAWRCGTKKTARVFGTAGDAADHLGIN